MRGKKHSLDFKLCLSTGTSGMMCTKVGCFAILVIICIGQRENDEQPMKQMKHSVIFTEVQKFLPCYYDNDYK